MKAGGMVPRAEMNSWLKTTKTWANPVFYYYLGLDLSNLSIYDKVPYPLQLSLIQEFGSVRR